MRHRHSLQRLIRVFDELALLMLSVAAMCAATTHFPETSFYLAELFGNFAVQHAVAAFLVGGLFVFRKRRRSAMLAAAVSVLHAGVFLPLYRGAPSPPNGAPLRVLLMNVWTRNTQCTEVLEAVRAQRPDVVGVLEVR